MTADPAGGANSTDGQPRLTDLTLVEQADVYKGADLAARLTRTPDGVRFDYLPGWLAAGGDPVASTLPLSAAAVVEYRRRSLAR